MKLLGKMKQLLKRVFHREHFVFSVGENCLVDNILSRNGLKSFSSPCASARSNVEYLLAFEEENYADFLNPAFLCYEIYEDKPVVRNKKYVNVSNVYHHTVTNGFEFSHHDVLSEEEAHDALERRVKRVLDLKHADLTLVYHHRMCNQTDEKLLALHLSRLAKCYTKRGNRVRVVAFSQALVSDPADRRWERYETGDVCFYRFYTFEEWLGNDQDIFWARVDDDLLEPMVAEIGRYPW